MKKLILNIFIAFFISLLIHFILLNILQNEISKNKLQISTTNKIQKNKKNGFTSIKYVKIKKKERKNLKPIVENIKKSSKPIKPKKIKKLKKIKKKTIKKVLIKKEIKAIQSTVNKNKVDLKKLFTIQKTDINTNTKIEMLIKQKAIEKQEEVKELQQLDKLTQSYIKLYGEKYFSFSKKQKKYLKDNLNIIGRVTQKYLTYPTISIRTRQSGINIIEFFLHPNGDITDVKITDSSNYTALDQNTLNTIQIAYKDYPKPIQTVKIKIYVKYILN